MFGDDAKYPIAGVGIVPIELEFVNSLNFDDVSFVPGLRKNLLLASIIEDKGYVFKFN